MNDHLVPDYVPILGIEVSRFPSYDAAVELVRKRLLKSLPTFCVAVNPEKIYRAKRDPVLKATLEKAHVRLCDGIGISLASLVLNRKPIARCTGVDLFLRLIQMSADEGFRVFVLGASSRVNEVSCNMLRTTFPGILLAGRHDGFFDSDQEIVRQINESQADLLFVAMGSPRQEDWIARNMSQLRPRLLMGIGGSLDVVSGTVRRAPAPFRKAGLEWLYRLLSQPSRFRRQLALLCFGWDVLREISVSRTRYSSALK